MSQRPIRKIFLQWYRFLPYHLARIGAARQLLGTDGITVEGLETASQDEIYKQNDIADATIFPRHTIFEGRSFHTIPVPEIRDGVLQTLDRLQPDAIAINGYGIADGRACLLWCRRNHRPAILMSESWEGDAKRSWPREWLKSLIVRQFSAALVGGNRHQS